MYEKGSVGRPREFDEADVMDRITDVFWRKGFEGTSLADLVEVTGLKKGSLYTAFGDKQAMYLKALKFYEERVVDPAAHNLMHGTAGAERRIRDFLNLPIEAVWSHHDWRGCFLCNASADHAESNAETADLVSRGFDKLESALKAALVEGGAPQKEARMCARTILTVYSGLRIMARSGRARAALESARDGALEFIRLKCL